MSTEESLSDTILPKSDQLNADQLVGTTLTITVLKVSRVTGDQPVAIHYEGEDGRPYKPCKTMRKILVAAWGEYASGWVGKSMTLYNDPEVMFGGVKMGGIRISHLSHIESDLSLALNKTKGKKAIFNVKRMQAEQKKAAPQPPAGGAMASLSADQLVALQDALDERGVSAESLCTAASGALSLPIEKLSQIPADFYGKACGWIRKQTPAPQDDFTE